MEAPIVVTGAPGAGKTALAAHLARELALPVALPGGHPVSRRIDALRLEGQGVTLADAQGGVIVETCAYADGYAGDAGLLIAVIDAVPLSGQAGALAEAERALVEAADLVVLTRSDLVDPAAARAVLTRDTETPIVEAVFGKLLLQDLPTPMPHRIDLPPRPAPAVWEYSGGARLDEKLAEQLLKNRPKGTTRIKGLAVSGDAGLMLDQAGRARSVSGCELPEETILFASGPKGTFSEQDMGLHFAEVAAAGAATAGWFGFR